MKYFAGLDVSLDETAICIVDEDGIIVTEGKAASEPDDLAQWLAATGLAITRLGLEAGPLSPWLHAGLRAAGLRAAGLRAAGDLHRDPADERGDRRHGGQDRPQRRAGDRPCHAGRLVHRRARQDGGKPGAPPAAERSPHAAGETRGDRQ
jgi:hypothetical protein